MKIKVTMKDPNTLIDAIHSAVNDWSLLDLSEDEMIAIRQYRKESIHAMTGKWFKHGEYLTVEIDTVARTCVVLEAKQ